MVNIISESNYFLSQTSVSSLLRMETNTLSTMRERNGMMDVTTLVHVKMAPLDIMNAYHRKLLNKYIKFLLKLIDFFS